MQKYKVISAKIPEQLYQEFALRIPEGKRSVFIRKAIREKLEKTPRPNKLLALEQKIAHLQKDMNKIKDNLTKLEILTHEQGKINPNIFCTDEIDTKIIHYLLDYRGATTTELADVLKTNRWLILNRLRKISKASKKQLGNPIVIYYPGERAGKRKAWWLQEDMIEH